MLLERLPSLVRGRVVVELGCGVALPSAAAVLAGARLALATDYPGEIVSR
jgi:predicted nicotinamide N-methyase